MLMLNELTDFFVTCCCAKISFSGDAPFIFSNSYHQ